MKDFIDRHWGDICALYLLHLGVAIIVIFHNDSDVSHIGESLVLAGMATMRFKGLIANGGSK